MEQFWTIFWGAIGTVLTALASWGSVMLTTWLSSKIKDKKLQRLSLALNDIVTRAVMTVTQTYVESMKKKNAFDGEAQKEALKRCKEIVDAQLTQELRDFVQENFKDVESYITSLIESTILGLKK